MANFEIERVSAAAKTAQDAVGSLSMMARLATIDARDKAQQNAVLWLEVEKLKAENEALKAQIAAMALSPDVLAALETMRRHFEPRGLG